VDDRVVTVVNLAVTPEHAHYLFPNTAQIRSIDPVLGPVLPVLLVRCATAAEAEQLLTELAKTRSGYFRAMVLHGDDPMAVAARRSLFSDVEVTKMRIGMLNVWMEDVFVAPARLSSSERERGHWRRGQVTERKVEPVCTSMESSLSRPNHS
jgi:hypothetical protein